MNHSVILQGQFFEAGSSKARPARLTVAASDHLEARIIFAAGEEKAVEITAISDRLGAVWQGWFGTILLACLRR